MCANLALRQADGLDDGFKLGETEGGETEAAGYLIHHALVFGGVRLAITVKMVYLAALKVHDDAAREEQIVEKVRAMAGAEYADSVERVYRALFAAACDYEQKRMEETP